MIQASILSEIAPNVALPVWGGASLLILERTFALYRSYRDSRDNQAFREHYIAQTEVLRNIHSEQIAARNTADKIHKGVIQLKTISGIPDTDTVITRKEDVHHEVTQ